MVLPQWYRDKCCQAMLYNIAGIAPLREGASYDTVVEMIRVGMLLYQQGNRYIAGDTLDRYSWSPYGNHNEVVAIGGILHHLGTASLSAVEICRTRDEQYHEKIDFKVGGYSYQVKTVDYGSRGDTFVSLADRKGSADYIIYVDNDARRLIIIDTRQFTSWCNQIDVDYDVLHPITDHRFKNSIKSRPGSHEDDWRGHYIDDATLPSCGGMIITLPPHIQTLLKYQE